MKHTRSYQYILPGTIVFSIFLMLIGICIGDASEILPGLWKIVTMQDLLITDYIDIAGPGRGVCQRGACDHHLHLPHLACQGPL